MVRARPLPYPGEVRVVCLLVVAVAGCGFDVAASKSDGGTDGVIDPDAEPDAPDAPAICQAWHPRHFDPCAIGTPKPGLHLTVAGSPYTYDTTQLGGTLHDNTMAAILQSNVISMQSDGSMIAILSVDAFAEDPNVTLTVTGDKPLLIASWDTITIGGTIDAGSVTAEVNNTANAHIDGPRRTGAGANPTGHCTGMTGTAGGPAVTSGGSGGGGGGANHGNGGGGTTGDTTFQPGGPGGMHVAMAPAVVRGGCAGGASGNAATSTGLQPPATSASVSVGGAGGGAIELAAMTAITVTGTISAGGAGGAGAPQGSAVGGGGGGSGGYVGLDAAVLTVAGGTLGANGGGGGSAACYAGEGNQGSNALGAAQALGGPPGTLPGAPGSVGANLNGVTATGADGCGGGGGGGGAGFILVWSPAFTGPGAMISPPIGG